MLVFRHNGKVPRPATHGEDFASLAFNAISRMDEVTKLHCRSVGNIGEFLMRRALEDAPSQFGRDERARLAKIDTRSLRAVFALHDIGKLGIRGDIVSKPGALTAEEFEEMK
ncbi:MAG: hypothetical protein LBL52_01155, partial [Rickettsiales bacterium]|nr:hypothetical protein [Rickettsiales bacterium]